MPKKFGINQIAAAANKDSEESLSLAFYLAYCNYTTHNDTFLANKVVELTLLHIIRVKQQC